MPTERAYLIDPHTLEFDAIITGRPVLPDGRRGLVLDKTYFYPTGGGQEHDAGTLGPARVLDVFADEEGTIIHIVDQDAPGTTVGGKIDRARRFAFMQHHSAQHLLSQAVEKTLGLETIAVHISIESLSTIDFPTSRIDERGLERAEELANALIYEDRPIRSYFVPSAEIGRIPLRRPPKVQGEVRIVEIDRFDYSACGGTHCTSTGMIGIVKIVKAEKRGEETRIYFVAGELARRLFHEEHATLVRLAQRLNANPETALAALDRQVEQIRELEQQLKGVKANLIVLEAKQLAASAEKMDALRFVRASFQDRPPAELRQLGSLLQNEPGLIAIIASHDGAKVSLATSCARDTGIKANDLIKRLLAPLGGKGGGDAQLAQGGGSANVQQYEQLLASSHEQIR